MTNNTHIPSCLSQEDIEFMLENPGTTIGSGPNIPAEVRQASRSVDISQPLRKGLRPNVSGNSVDHTGERIKVSPNLAKKLAEGDAVIRAERVKQQVEEEAQKAAVEETSADKVLARLNYLERTVKQQAKQIKELRNEAS